MPVEEMLEQLDQLRVSYAAACELDDVHRLRRAIEVYKECESLINKAEMLRRDCRTRSADCRGHRVASQDRRRVLRHGGDLMGWARDDGPGPVVVFLHDKIWFGLLHLFSPAFRAHQRGVIEQGKRLDALKALHAHLDLVHGLGDDDVIPPMLPSPPESEDAPARQWVGDIALGWGWSADASERMLQYQAKFDELCALDNEIQKRSKCIDLFRAVQRLADSLTPEQAELRARAENLMARIRLIFPDGGAR